MAKLRLEDHIRRVAHVSTHDMDVALTGRQPLLDHEMMDAMTADMLS